MFAPIFKTARSRAIWLGINLLTAFLASAVIGMFEHTIEKSCRTGGVNAIVASMGALPAVDTNARGGRDGDRQGRARATLDG